MWSQGKQKLHKFSHSALSPSPRRNWVGIQTMLGVKTGCRGGERDLLCVRLVLQQINKKWSGSVVEEMESFDLASPSPCLCFLNLISFHQSARISRCETTLTISPTLKSDKRIQHNDGVVPPNGHSWAVQGLIGGVSWQKKNNKPTRNSADGAGKPCLSTRCSCHTRHWGVRQCVSFLCGGHNTDHKALDSLS